MAEEVKDVIRNVVMFDMDGCVSDDKWRRNLILKDVEGDAAYADYHECCDRDPILPNGAAILRSHIANNEIILFCTARPIKVGDKTAKWISTNFGINPQTGFSILMRQDGDKRGTVEVKREFAQFIIENAKRNGSSIVAAYDDRQDIVDAYRELGINAAVLDENGIHQPPAAAATDVPFVDSPSEGKTVPELLTAAAKLYEDRNALYKDNYKRVGEIYLEMFPAGITLKSSHDFNRFTLFMLLVHKLNRYAFNFNTAHADSLEDLAVYAMMLKELDS